MQFQATGGDAVGVSGIIFTHFLNIGSRPLRTATQMLQLELQMLGFRCWLDTKAKNLTKEGMAKGIAQAGCFLLFLSKGVLQREYVHFEVREALSLEKHVVLVHEMDARVSAQMDTVSSCMISLCALLGT